MKFCMYIFCALFGFLNAASIAPLPNPNQKICLLVFHGMGGVPSSEGDRFSDWVRGMLD